MADFAGADGAVDVAEKIDIDEPPSGRVIFFNDDYTTKDFVVDVLVSVFDKTEGEATRIMETVHRSGRATVGVYAFDIASTRAQLAMHKAREQGFPLMVKVQEDWSGAWK